MSVEDNLKYIYSKLCDDVSKHLFKARLIRFLLDDDEPMNQLIEEYKKEIFSLKEWKSFLENTQKDRRKKYIFGCGAFGKRIYDYTKEQVEWAGFIDSNIADVKEYNGCTVFPLNRIDFSDCNNAFYLPSQAYFYEMKEQLMKLGVAEKQINDATIIFNLTEGKQYFDLPYLPHVKDEIFVDCGAYDGMSSIEFVNWCNKDVKKIICFEPDKSNIQKITDNFESRKQFVSNLNYEIIDKGLWKNCTTLNFVMQGNASSYIVEGDVSDLDVSSKVDVVSLDETIADEKVTFIKMDIEGSEYNALEGAKEIIKRDKPKMAICVYHKKEDIWKIPEKILEIRDDYKFYLRHYSFGMTETVLYCI